MVIKIHIGNIDLKFVIIKIINYNKIILKNQTFLYYSN